jgi:diguanylate cyclase (GGDEF)-like protein
MAAAGLLVLCAVFVYSVLPGVRAPGESIGWLDNGVANVVQVGSALLCLGTGWRRRQWAWSMAGIGLCLWVVGDLYWQFALADRDPIPYPSLADALYLGFYPCAYVAVVLLLRQRLVRFRASMWLDGAIGALGTAALVAALAFGSILSSTDGSPAVIATNLAYPIGDVLLLSLVVGAFGLLGLRPGLRWWLLGAGFGCFAVADTVYLWQTARDTYTLGTLVDAGWAVGLLLIALASRAPESRTLREREVRGWTVMVVPALFALTSLGILAWDSGTTVPDPAVWLGAATVAVGIARVVLTFGEVNALAESRRQARSDDLTGLMNRRGFHEHARRLIDRAPTAGDAGEHPFALVLLDLDRFKEVNDSLGHLAGDQLLVHVAERLADVLSAPQDVLARLGGDEFAVLLDGADAEAALMASRRFAGALEVPVEIDGVRLRADASIGIALYPDHGTELDVLLEHADIAMYAAKSTPTTASAAVYTWDQDLAARNRVDVLEQLRHALTVDGELVVHYQPKVDLHTDRVEGVEALVRWQHPVRGLLQPDAFLPLVEESGLVQQLTVHVLGLALRQAQQWRESGLDLTVAVNLSAASVVDPGLPELVGQLLGITGLPSSSLVLEMTEEVLLSDRERTRAVLADLRDRGMRVAIDAYGTGHSSLAALQELPVDELKLDASFVHGMDDDLRAPAVVAATVALAHALGLRLVAEGVETAAAEASLRAMGCDAAQGFHFSSALPAEELTLWLDIWTAGLAGPVDAVPGLRSVGRAVAGS